MWRGERGEKKAWSRGGAFTIVEVLIVLALLVTLAALTLPTVLTRGLGDARADTQRSLSAALLDARREAQRTGRTLELVWVQPRDSNGEAAVIEIGPLTESAAGDESLQEGDLAMPEIGLGEDLFDGLDTASAGDEGSGDGSAGDDLSGVRATIAYVLPDGSLEVGGVGLVFELDDGLYRLEIDRLALRARLVETVAGDLEPAVSEETDSLMNPGLDVGVGP